MLKLPRKKKEEKIELQKSIPTSVISVNRKYELSLDILDPKTIDQLYAVVPEIKRALDLRSAAVIARGFEISPRDNSEEAKRFASECLAIINNSGGVSFIRQWYKNAEAYGNGYVELVGAETGADDPRDVTHLAHVHSYNFGYELEKYDDEGTPRTRVKLDSETQLPTAFASYKFNETDSIFETDKTFPLMKIGHFKVGTIGDALYGVSIVQPMYGSVTRKLKIEDSIEAAARLVAAPKIVINGDFATEEEARQEAKEAASLDVNDVVILNNGEDFKFVTPGDTNLPKLRDIFVTNITTATGIPRPILTSEGNDINKATIRELIKHLRENMRADMNEMKRVIEEVFRRIALANGFNEELVPVFDFPEDDETEDDIIVREERKAATLTSLSNSVMIMSNVLNAENAGNSAELKTSMEEAMKKTLELYIKTMNTFIVNNDQTLGTIEEKPAEKKEAPNTKTLTLGYEQADAYVVEENALEEEIPTSYPVTMLDDIDTIYQPEVVYYRHQLMHHLYEEVQHGAEIHDIETGRLVTLPQIVNKHKQYVKIMGELGMVHEPSEVGSELDQM